MSILKHKEWCEDLTNGILKKCPWLTQEQIGEKIRPNAAGIANALVAISTDIFSKLPFNSAEPGSENYMDIAKSIERSMCCLRGGEESIRVTVTVWPEPEKLNTQWPSEKIEIIDSRHNQKIILGTGIHSEIVNITSLQIPRKKRKTDKKITNF